MYTVRQLSRIAGVTPRTLRHYDAIGLLKPARVGENGYRYYGEESLLQLQGILFYRELGLPLGQIKRLRGRRDFDVSQALEGHKQELRKRIARMERLIATVDQTLSFLKGENSMSGRQLFEGFSEEQQAGYEREVMQTYDPATVKASAVKWKNYSAAQKEQIQDEGNAVYAGFLAAMPQGPASAAARACVERWRRHIEYFWTPDDAQLRALAESYNTDARFKARFDRLDPGLAAFIRDAAAAALPAGR
jgi:DNA-binding transcriptional MerR regulator